MNGQVETGLTGSSIVDLTGWEFQASGTTHFTWRYDAKQPHLTALYDKAKASQWDQASRIDWSLDLDPDNPAMVADSSLPLYGSDIWEKLSKAERRSLRHHHQAYTFSQFLHGEQGALIASAKIVESCPDFDAKLFAASQVYDEARHVEIYARLLREKFELSYPINYGLRALLEAGLTDPRWDFPYLTLQVLIEGMALAAFQSLRDFSRHPLVATLNAYVMQDEARHVAFGRLALAGFYHELGAAELKQREDFIIEGLYLLMQRFAQREMWERLGLPVERCIEAALNSTMMEGFLTQMFSRIIATLKGIDLWSIRMQSEFLKLGVSRDAIALSQGFEDESIALNFEHGDRGRRVEIMYRLARGAART